ncbi:histidine kinase dimerization/phosphoacceptor domain -containing protein [uncultured Roseivirga sp.]|uniref:tetratricopeptide repeat-containing sensor histidine kinase n=1 Tax=uncultured Roseivirga sp. TaxID=543088 RepID=UPI00258414ED|nr:histidine kinase dimerization/phosphoacceptor domain -containing protein [uncultured Roseivirga sp.]
MRDTAIVVINRAMAIQKERGLKEQLAKTQFDLGYTYQGMSDFETAILHYDSIIARNIEEKTEYDLARAYNFSGLCSYYLRKLEPATQRILEAIKYRKEKGDTAGIHRPYMVYGLILKEQKEYEEAKSYIRRSGEIAKLSNLTRRIQLAYTNLGQVLVLQDSIDEAIAAFEEAWEYQQKLGWTPVDYYNSLAWAEEKRGDYRKNHEYMVEAVKTIPATYALKSKADVLIGLVNAKIFLADSVYNDFTSERNKLLNEAIPHLERAWNLVNPINARNVKLEVAETAAKLFAKLRRFEEAFEYSQIARELSDEVNDRARTEAIAKMTTEFETERVEGENALLQETQKRQVAQLKQQRYLILAGLAVLVLVAAITIIIQRNRVKLKKANTIVQKSLEEKELLLKEIHHRVKNNLQVVSSLLDLQSRGIEDEKALSTFMEGQNRVKAMALIHQKLYQNEDLATIDFAEYAEQLMAELATIYPSSGEVATKISAQGKSNFDIDTAIPLGLILNELISNAYKYAFGESKGELNVSIESLGSGKHQLTVSDTGQGLPADFEIAKVKSLGLRLVRRLSKQLYGSAEYYYEQGSKFIITFTDTLERKSI